jgi:hypothetical protein
MRKQRRQLSGSVRWLAHFVPEGRWVGIQVFISGGWNRWKHATPIDAVSMTPTRDGLMEVRRRAVHLTILHLAAQRMDRGADSCLAVFYRQSFQSQPMCAL